MKPRKREINIFNLSMMDVISGALGAFLIIVIILLPYYKKNLAAENRKLKEQIKSEQTARQKAEQAKSRAQKAQRMAELARQKADEARKQAEAASQKAMQETQQARQAFSQASQELQQAKQNIRDLKKRLKQTFIVILIKWKTQRHDVDLHVIDPNGNEFYFQRKKITGQPGELSEDDKIGPGLEVWEIRNAPPGKYKIYYNLFSRRGNKGNPTVSGRVFFRDGSKEIPDSLLTQLKSKKYIATVTVKNNGIVEVR